MSGTVVLVVICVFFFFKQKTAYEMRIRYWSSDVCSSDLFGDDGRPDLRGGGRDQGGLFPSFRVEGGSGGRGGGGLDRPRAPDVRDAAARPPRRSAGPAARPYRFPAGDARRKIGRAHV